MDAASESVRVVVRCRPFNEREKRQGESSIVSMDTSSGSITIKNPKKSAQSSLGASGMAFPSDDMNASKAFHFDNVFDENCRQIDVYNLTARPIVDAVLEGYNGTIFAYGQTGTGKSFSMEGVRDDVNLRGIIPNSFNHIFQHIGASTHKQFLVRVSYLEIYNEDIRDLLNPNNNNNAKLELKEHPEYGVYVKDLSNFVVKSIEEMEQLMAAGHKNRSVGATNMNEHSSRSHSIFSMTIECSDKGGDASSIRAGKLHLVDLAGSERQSKTGATGDRLKEATKINLSLSALGNCISALVDGKSTHIPYRDSKLTRLLQDSLGGNAKTLMIATLSPAAYNYDESISTLRYANRAKNIKNKPKINEDPKDALLREYQEEIKRLMDLLQSKKGTQAPVSIKQASKSNSSDIEEIDHEDDDDVEEIELNDNEERIEGEGEAGQYEERKAQLKHQLTQALESKELVQAEKNKLTSQLKNQLELLEKERLERDRISQQIKAIESKLLEGGVNIFDRISTQEQALLDADNKLRERQVREREMEYQLEQQLENTQELEEHYNNLQEEVDAKTGKLKKMVEKIQGIKVEIDDLMEEFRGEKGDLLDTIRELNKELELKNTVIDNFIPPVERLALERSLTYNESKDDWEYGNTGSNRSSPVSGASRPALQLYNTKRIPVATPGLRKPISQMAQNRIMMGDPNPRFRPENVLTLSLDMPERTTFDFEEASSAMSIPSTSSNTRDSNRLSSSSTTPTASAIYSYGNLGGASATASFKFDDLNANNNNNSSTSSSRANTPRAMAVDRRSATKSRTALARANEVEDEDEDDDDQLFQRGPNNANLNLYQAAEPTGNKSKSARSLKSVNNAKNSETNRRFKASLGGQ